MDTSSTPRSQFESSPHQRTCLGLMAKYWSANSVKTRLGATIGMPQSARMHQLFVSELARRLSDLKCNRFAVVSPPDRQPEFGRFLGDSWKTVPQSDGDLGQRMRRWFVDSLSEHSASILIGADCPTLCANSIDQTVSLLNTNDIVLGPAIDGGYYLIALSGPWRDQFDVLFSQIPWSTENVMSLTCDSARKAGLSVGLLDEREDIDEIDALERLRAHLSESNHKPDAEFLQQINTILQQEPNQP